MPLLLPPSAIPNQEVWSRSARGSVSAMGRRADPESTVRNKAGSFGTEREGGIPFRLSLLT